MKRLLILTAIFLNAWTLPALSAADPGNKFIHEGAETASLPTFDLDFGGGSPAGLVAAIEKALGKPVNVILPRDSETYQYPEMHIRSVTLEDIFVALSQSKFLTNAKEGYTVMTSYWSSQNPRDPRSIWVLHITDQERMARTGVELYPLESILQNSEKKIEDVTYAIQTAWEMAGIENQAEMKYHAETQLLIARGSVQAIRILEGVIESLQEKNKPVEPIAYSAGKGPHPDTYLSDTAINRDLLRAEQQLRRQVMELKEKERQIALREEELRRLHEEQDAPGK